jgi:hypothetical protein
MPHAGEPAACGEEGAQGKGVSGWNASASGGADTRSAGAKARIALDKIYVKSMTKESINVLTM